MEIETFIVRDKTTGLYFDGKAFASDREGAREVRAAHTFSSVWPNCEAISLGFKQWACAR